MKNYKFIIYGKVQGVYYRVNVKNNALNATYKGYVKNMPDGTVEACVTCQDSELDSFLDILKKGSPNSEVKEIHTFTCKEIFNKPFEIR